MIEPLENSNNLFILRSASPRRKQILEDLGLRFLVVPTNVDESEKESERPLEYLERMVHLKLQSDNYKESTSIACDTIVVYENQILHKPQDKKDAIRILKILSGKKHQVHSGAALSKPGKLADFFYDTTEIQFRTWNQDEIEHYVESAKPFDKAGSYGIQDKNSPVENWIGSYINVIGFPLRGFFQRIDDWKSFLKV